jgi:hypothetical protein
MGCIQSSGESPNARNNSLRGIEKKKALLVGINYRWKGANELRGCINDVVAQRKVLVEQYGFDQSDILVLTEDEAQEQWPQKKRIQEGFSWLFDGVSSGDLLFFHFSGHGSIYGSSECIVPLDFDKPWRKAVITNDEIHQTFYDRLPKGAKGVCVFDCCHSGHIAELEVEMDRQISSNDFRIRYMEPHTGVATTSCLKEVLKEGRFKNVGQYTDRDLWVFSGCHHDQTSADAYINGVYQGAFTWAFLEALSQGHGIYCDLLRETKKNLSSYTQDPVLSTTSQEKLQYWYLGRELN